MSIQIQCCGIVVVLILLLFQSSQRRTHLDTERAFRWVVWTALANLLLDVVSALVVNHAFSPGPARLSIELVDFIGKAYLLSLLAIGLVTVVYLCTDIFFDQPKLLLRKAAVYGALTLVGAVCIVALPIDYEFSQAGVVTNHTGPSVYAAYVSITCYLLLIVYHVLRYRRRLNRRRFQALIVWIALWVGSFIAQLLIHHLLLAGFAGATGILVIYLVLENPEANLDRQTGLFTRSVLVSYIKQLYGQGKDFSVLVMIFDRSQELRRGWRSTEEVRMKLIRYLEAQRNWMVFKESSDRLYFIFDDPQKATQAMEQVNEYESQQCRDHESLPVKVRWLFAPSAAGIAENQVDLLGLLKEITRQYPSGRTEPITVDEKMAQDIRQARKIERLLTAAMDEDRIEVFYQPIYSVPLRRITGAEALVRIRDEEGRLVPPGLFIPIAENNGTILRLGKMIFEHVCRFIHQHPLQELGLTHIDVNLSVVQCAYHNLAMDYMDIMRRYSVDPRQINLEITESASADDKSTLLTNMDKLINYGVSFSLDDFGTGQSNLNYIMEMPVVVAKFDRGMTQSYFTTNKAKKVMNATIRMIHDMGLSIVSEGVETQEEYQTIQSLGIEFIQGYYFSKPLPAQEFLEFLRTFEPPVPQAS